MSLHIVIFLILFPWYCVFIFGLLDSYEWIFGTYSTVQFPKNWYQSSYEPGTVQQICLAQWKVKDIPIPKGLLKTLKGNDGKLEKMTDTKWIVWLHMFIGQGFESGRVMSYGWFRLCVASTRWGQWYLFMVFSNKGSSWCS